MLLRIAEEDEMRCEIRHIIKSRVFVEIDYTRKVYKKQITIYQSCDWYLQLKNKADDRNERRKAANKSKGLNNK